MKSQISKPKQTDKAQDTLPFPISAKLKRFLDKIHFKINNKDTFKVGILWGGQGSGKSVMAQKIAYIVNGGKIELDTIAFNKNEFIQAILKGRKSTIIADEGISIFFSRGAMSKEGRLMAELMGQIRQRNLLVLICIWDILLVDASILKMANFIAYVWETEKEINGRSVTIKGNMALYPDFKKYSFKNKMIKYLKIQKSGNYLIKNPMPKPWLQEPGQPFGDGFKPCWYGVSEDDYRHKKESILEKYRMALERKQANRKIDFTMMDKLIGAGMKIQEIAKTLNVSPTSVSNRKKLIGASKKIKPMPHRKTD